MDERDFARDPLRAIRLELGGVEDLLLRAERSAFRAHAAAGEAKASVVVAIEKLRSLQDRIRRTTLE